MRSRLGTLVLINAIAAGIGIAVGLLPELKAQRSKDIHDPANAVANLEIHKDLQATLFASEPMITNPTNLDIDYRGRVWICDVKNYRGNNGRRPDGDRILILEDTDGDGKADTVKTFYQGRDVDSAMGICVLGNKVIVSCSPNVLVFTFDDHDRVLKKDVLFTKTGMPQHDHSAHSFLFGPDGRLYWNFGNTGQSVHDKNGKPVIDLAGNQVNDRGNPYRNGMVFRCELDGSNFEVLAHNFRNNYEVTVDSFGTLWQSDNDDDGNRGVRINFVMEYGNFGYVDEVTGAGWQTKRTNMEKEIPLRHWHLNDPGVVPNLLQTGGGSPTGICIYEGKLLPKIFQNQVIHCDAGPSIVRAYPAVPDGAGYKASIVNILDGQKKNNWFRPADVCVAPDGSIFVTDWYDPGVGGHGQADLDRGRIFRVALPGNRYTVPRCDVKTTEGAIAALKNPNLAVRYLAWTALHEMAEKAEPALLKLFESKDPVYRARALWLLGRIDGRGMRSVDMALADVDPDIQIVGVRLARQLKMDVISLVSAYLRKTAHAPSVLRECAIALRHNSAPGAAKLWAGLARLHDGNDRWYLEALGIGADKQWDAFLDAYLELAGSDWKTKSGRDIIWRSRAKKTPEYLAKLIADQATPVEELPRLFRALDFQKRIDNEMTLWSLALGGGLGTADRQAFITTEAMVRLSNKDLTAQPQLAVAVSRYLDRVKGTPTFVEVVGKLHVLDRYPDLLALAQKHATEQLGVDAIRILLDRNQDTLVRGGLESKDPAVAISTVQALASAGHNRAGGLLLRVVRDPKRDLEVRRQATRALAKYRGGALELLRLTRSKQLAKELEPAAGSALSVAVWQDVRKQAGELFPLPPGKDNKPLPSITQLTRLRGDAARGKIVFAKAGTCATCHVVNGEGKEVGPNLSEIGKKLGREALFESILYPSASISHNYESYVVETKKGDVVNGLLVSQTPDEVAIKSADAIVRTFRRADIDTLARSPISIMPADLHKALTPNDLADLVEYLLTLREARK
jgi:putative membrane-bound dehydrogenase-like protein